MSNTPPAGGRLDQPADRSADPSSTAVPVHTGEVFVGRALELTALRAKLDEAFAARCNIVLLAGEPGIGKTSLAAELATTARERGALLLWGRGHDGGDAPAYWLWMQVFRDYLDAHGAAAIVDAMGAAAADLLPLAPSLADHLHDGRPRAEAHLLDPDQARFRLHDRVAALLRQAAARQPLLLVLDDLHWADAASLALLQFLARELRGARVLILGAYRDGEAGRGRPLTQALAGLAQTRLSERMLLHGLSEGDVARFMEVAAGAPVPPALAAAVYQQTDGNPFYMTEVVRHLIQAQGSRFQAQSNYAGAAGGKRETVNLEPGTLVVPPSVREVIAGRLASVSATCASVLTIAAVIGREFALAPLQQVSALADDVLLEALEEAEAARLIAATPETLGAYRFTQALIGVTLYEDLSSIRRARLHQQVARTLESYYAHAIDAHLAELAFHFAQAAPLGDIATAVDYARRAGEHALAQLDYDGAVRLYGIALQALELREPVDEAHRCELLLALGQAQQRAGAADIAQATFERAAAIAQATGTPEHLARAAIGFSGFGAAVGPMEPAHIRLLDASLVALGAGDSALRARVLARLAQAHAWTQNAELAQVFSREAVEIARRVGDPVALATSLYTRRSVLAGPQGLAERLVLAAEVDRLANEMDDRDLAVQARRWRILDELELGHVEAVDREIESFARLARASRRPYYQWHAAVFRAMRALLAGRFAEAERLIARAFELGRKVEDPGAAASFAVQLFALEREQDERHTSESVLTNLATQYPTVLLYRAALAVLAADAGREFEARRQVETLAAECAADVAPDGNWLAAVTLVAEACVLLGDAPPAALLRDLLAPYADRVVVAGAAVLCLGAVAHPLGRLAALLGERAAAAQYFEQALAIHTRMGVRPAHARTAVAYAALLLDGGDDDERAMAASLLARSRAAAHDLGMTRLAGEIAALIGSGNLTPGPSPAALERGAYTVASEPASRVAEGWPPRPDKAPLSSSAGEGPGVRLSPAPPPNSLTRREVEVLRLLAGGLSNRGIAERLVLSVGTVERHVFNLYRKIGARGRAEATAYALRQGIV